MQTLITILFAVFAFFFLAGCYPTVSDVKEMQRQEYDFIKDQVDAHDANMTAQHKLQTPEVSNEVEALRQQNAELMATILGAGKEKVTATPTELGDVDFGNLVAGALGLIGIGVAKFGGSRAKPEVDKLTHRQDQIAAIMNQVVSAVNQLRPGTVAAPVVPPVV